MDSAFVAMDQPDDGHESHGGHCYNCTLKSLYLAHLISGANFVCTSPAVYFWWPSGPNSYLSIFANIPFESEGNQYASVQQYTMFQKAMLQSLGRAVAGFDSAIWAEELSAILRRGFYDMITTSAEASELQDRLLATESRFIAICMASGHAEKTADESDKSDWGLNKLGFAIMEVRLMLQVHHKIAVPMFGQPPWERFTDSTPERARRPWLQSGIGWCVYFEDMGVGSELLSGCLGANAA
ncbi:hypothetical protein F4604DRAFT_1918579 [Suillus subluteus]|nr:hypothetical protein F4604DRAFT_1918579 [Suillus subluteus]